MRARVVVQKLSFLHQLVSAERGSVGSRVLVSMGDDVEALCLVKECRELERAFGTKLTEKRLKDGADGVSKQHLKEIIFKIGRVTVSKLCGGGQGTFGGKDCTGCWMGGGVGCSS